MGLFGSPSQADINRFKRTGRGNAKVAQAYAEQEARKAKIRKAKAEKAKAEKAAAKKRAKGK